MPDDSRYTDDHRDPWPTDPETVMTAVELTRPLPTISRRYLQAVALALLALTLVTVLVPVLLVIV